MESSNTKISKPLRVDILEGVVVDVIIPFKENYSGVYKLLEMLQDVKNLRFTVTLVDDNSKNKTFFEDLIKLPGIKGHRFDEDKGFGYAVNHAIKNSENYICIILHSDLYAMEPKCLRNLVLELMNGKEDNICMVSSVTDIPAPKECSFMQRNHGEDEDSIVIEDDKFLPFICCAVSKSAFSRIGGLATYDYCWFEDKLFAKKAHAFGYKLAYSPRAFVRHVGGVSLKQSIKLNSRIVEFLKNNRLKFESDLQVLKKYLQKS